MILVHGAKLDFGRVESAFQEAVRQGVFPGAVVLAAKGEEVVFERAFGYRSLTPDREPMEIDDLFDVASLTKPLATTTAVMRLVQENRIALDEPARDFLGASDMPQFTPRQLLAHTSGLPAWRAYYRELAAMDSAGGSWVGAPQAKAYVYRRVRDERLEASPGSRGIYSDLGFILLGELVETVTGLDLDRFCEEKIFAPLKLKGTFFNGGRLRPSGAFVATERCPWRARVLRGEVHDENAYAMGGVAGHAGLFSSARDIHRLICRLRACYRGKDAFLDEALMREFFRRDQTVAGWTYALGWDTPSRENSSSGRYFSNRSVGHLGFTGTSIWWDLERDCHIVLLTNRVHPTRENDKIRAFRPHAHDLIMERLLG
ncbi:MAG TPA: serine hydrolase domain-containing protein [Candidatus Acidoferrales bacterium]|nr:serine hydrolase domain-containing protein [Candidatus Acidoferrales bacterium]